MNNNRVPVTFVSEWEEGLVETRAMLDLDSGMVDDISTATDDESEHYESLIKEYITVDGLPIKAIVELTPDDEFYLSEPADLESLREHFIYGVNLRKKYAAHLCDRLFKRNDYGSAEALITAITDAKSVGEWQPRKQAFNLVGENAPFRENNGYSLKYEDVPGFIKREADAFLSSFPGSFTHEADDDLAGLLSDNGFSPA